MKKFALIAILLLIPVIGFGQKVPTTAYRVRANTKTITVTYKGASHIIKAGDHIDAALVTKAKILLASRIGQMTYLLIDVTGQSKLRGDDRECGAGTESNLIRVKLDSKWKVSDIDGVRYDSCWGNVVSEDGYEIKNGVLKLEYDDIRAKQNVKLEYDANDPESGFKTEKKKVEY